MSVEAFSAAVDVSRETLDRLTAYEALLRKWNVAINLVSPQTLSQVWTRHFLDSAQIFALGPDTARTWADLGSGGGFPGLVIAVLAAEKRPDLAVTLVESDRRKSAFLITAARELGLSVAVKSERIEALAPLQADILSARALAPLTDLLGFAERHLAPGGICLFPKGARWREELAPARERWSFQLDPHPSETESEAVILQIDGVKRV